jgi:hypothetical protein
MVGGDDMVRIIGFMYIMEQTAKVIRFFAPWIARAFMFILGMIITSVISFWGNVPVTVRRVADEWLDRAVMSGFPTQWDKHLYYVLFVLALSMVIFGWIALSYLTVGLVNLIF